MAIKFSLIQQQAIESTGQNIIVSAGAGSGKTAVLTERIRQILLKGTKASELLVLTFTNAAAKEMKERIVKAMAKDDQLKNRINEIDNAYITTFDSFSLSLVKKYHERLNLTNNINIVDESLLNVEKRRIINEIFHEYYINKNDKFACLISNFTLKNDNNLKNEILNLAKNISLRCDLDSYLDNYIINYFNENKINEYINDLTNILKDKIKYIQQCLKLLNNEIEENKYDKLHLALKPLFVCENYNQIKNYLDENSLPTFKNLSDNAKLQKENINNALDIMKELTIFNNIDDIKKFYFSSQKYVEIIIEILKTYFARLNSYKREKEAFEFIDIAKMAITLVSDYEDIKEQTKNQFKEILLDEYQDTSDLQETFIQKIANNNVYMVGDVKQSIYGYRNANPLIFKEKYDSYRDGINGKKIDMNVNYRSNNEVLNIVNNIFSQIMDDNIGQANFAKEHHMYYGLKEYDKSMPYLKIQYINYPKKDDNNKNEDIEMFYVLKDIQDKIADKIQVYDKDSGEFREVKYQDFAILIADSSLFVKISDLLSYNNIPNKILKNISVNEGIITILLKNILKIINLDYQQNYGNDFKRLFYGLGRSFIFKMTDEDLFDLLANNTFKESALYRFITNYTNKVNVLSLENLFNDLIDDLDIYNKLVEIGDIENNLTRIEYFHNLIKQAENLDLNLLTFVDYLDDILENEDKMEFQQSTTLENKINIMTIHKSKGLEFPIVYFISNYKKFNISEFKSKLSYDNKYGIITPFYENGEGRNINYILMKNYNKTSMISEKIRLLYVALTRAREHMIILNPIKIDKETNEPCEMITYKDENDLVLNEIRLKYNSFGSIYDSIYDIFPNVKMFYAKDLNINFEYLKTINKTNYQNVISKTNEKISYYENKNNSIIKENKHASKENKTLNTLESVLNMEYGSKVHEIFESFDFIKQDFSIYSENEKKMLKQFLAQDVVKNISKGKIYKEFEFIYQKDDAQIHGIIDLMIEYDDRIDIIDYKLSHIEDEAYIKQLTTYKEYISSKSTKNVNLYLYSINQNEIKKI